MGNAQKILIGLFFVGLLIIRPTPSYAWHGHDGWHGHGYFAVNVGWPGPYYYGYGYPYYPYYADPYYSPAYTVVSSSSYQPVVVNGVTYYVNNGVYYIYTQYGYQAVATPAGVTTMPVQAAVVSASPTATVDADDTYTVNISNNKGGYTAVLIKRSGKGFTGPQGEFYADFPKVSQLQVMYGK